MSPVANHTGTPNPSPPATYPVLYADEYGMLISRYLGELKLMVSLLQDFIQGISSGVVVSLGTQPGLISQ